MKNKLLLFLVWLLQKWIPKNRPNQRFLVIATTALGDSLWATPALESLRRSFPNAHIVLLTSPIGEQALRHNPWTDKIFLLKNPLFLWKALRAEQIDTVLNFHSSQRHVLPLVSLIGASNLVGTLGINKQLDSLLTHPLDNGKTHEIIRRLEMVEAAGGKRHTETLSFFLTNEEQENTPPLGKGRWVALHPGSKDRFKRWPAEHFGTVGRLLQQMGYQILITGNGEEKSLMERVAAYIPGAELSDSKLSLRSFAALLNRIDLLISNDTGPVHLACALKRPVLALYSATDPTLCGPHQAPNAFALAKRPSCAPCIKRKCLRPFCLLQIGPEEVANEARNMLKNIS
jgi:heptosyltransferase-1/heptosyltransferase-2